MRELARVNGGRLKRGQTRDGKGGQGEEVRPAEEPGEVVRPQESSHRFVNSRGGGGDRREDDPAHSYNNPPADAEGGDKAQRGTDSERSAHNEHGGYGF